MRNLLFGPTTTSSRGADAGLLVLRVIGGLALALLHGMGKMPPKAGFVGMVAGLGFPAPELFAWGAGIAEFAGGLLLALGLLSRLAAILVVLQFLAVTFVAHAGDSLSDRELPILFLAMGLTLLLTGPGRYSLDALLTRRR